MFRVNTNKRTLVRAMVICSVVAIALVAGALVAVAAGVWPTKQVTGTGTVTITQPQPPPPTPSVYDFTVTPATLDFSGSAVSGSVYTVTKQLTIQNTGSTGTDGGDATISGLTASVDAGTPLPTGWSLAGTYTGSLAPGASTTLDVVLTSPALTATVVLPTVTINVAAN